MPIQHRIGLLTAGGDCPGLNAVIRSVTQTALANGISVVGIEDGFLGLIENRVRELAINDVSEILAAGGTILGSSNKANPMRLAVGRKPDGSPEFRDVSERCLDVLASHRLTTVIAIGGDGSMTIASDLSARAAQRGQALGFIGVPKTIDNDLVGTDITFGFATAVATATDALDKVRTTAASHHRAMVVEVMGRNAGWIALHAGVAGGADVILVPELPFRVEGICDAIELRRKLGKKYSIICVAEGAKPVGGSQIVARHDPTSPDPIRLGGVGKFVADQIESKTGIESRYVVLGHVQRGGAPVAGDRVLSTLLGHHAVELMMAGAVNRMVAVQRGAMTDVSIADAAGKQRTILKDDPLIAAARATRTSFGE